MLALASPASAQIWGGPGGGAERLYPSKPEARLPRSETRMGSPGSNPRSMRQIRGEIDEALESGQIDRRTARRLRRDAARIQSMRARFNRGGLSDSELSELGVFEELLRDDLAAARSGAR
ncbi:hypothetical protein P1X14_15975 [Sphingomonas sp. AOB5]|uniref:hypothetical protein n=1 Tax=Sphingomonas sp. AOB5 TaxID=3034017 RepID=UPI0023F781DC|nr:hypothetical protein [Sphingomonas sp. AOB5]MDF7776756.1 hypothetical protein [Sphingomonas sp. AOB5]